LFSHNALRHKADADDSIRAIADTESSSMIG